MDPIQTILQPIWPLYALIRALIIFLDIGLLFLTMFAAVELFSQRPKFHPDPVNAAKRSLARAKSATPDVKEAWKAIRAKEAEGTREAIRIAVIEADGFVDNILKKRGYVGETFADRLQKFDSRHVPFVNEVWEAHRLRNDIVHTVGFEVSADRARLALDNYEEFLRALGVL